MDVSQIPGCFLPSKAARLVVMTFARFVGSQQSVILKIMDQQRSNIPFLVFMIVLQTIQKISRSLTKLN